MVILVPYEKKTFSLCLYDRQFIYKRGEGRERRFAIDQIHNKMSTATHALRSYFFYFLFFCKRSSIYRSRAMSVYKLCNCLALNSDNVDLSSREYQRKHLSVCIGRHGFWQNWNLHCFRFMEGVVIERTAVRELIFIAMLCFVPMRRLSHEGSNRRWSSGERRIKNLRRGLGQEIDSCATEIDSTTALHKTSSTSIIIIH